MAASADFLHDEQILDAVLDELARNLPAKWVTGTNPFFHCERREFGDLLDYDYPDEETFRNQCPMILVSSTGNGWVEPESAIGGKMMLAYPIRVVHVFTAEQCRDHTTSSNEINPTRSRMQRAAIINKAIFGDTTLRRLNSPTLTTDDAGLAAAVFCTDYVRTSYKGLPEIDALPGDFYGLAIDITVRTLTQ